MKLVESSRLPKLGLVSTGRETFTSRNDATRACFVRILLRPAPPALKLSISSLSRLITMALQVPEEVLAHNTVTCGCVMATSYNAKVAAMMKRNDARQWT